MGNISIWQLLILLLIVLLVFGTRRLRNVGTDLGGAIKGFRKGLKEDDGEDEASTADPPPKQDTADTTTSRD